MSRIQPIITQHTHRSIKRAQFSMEKAINRYQPQDSSNAGITKDLKIMIITVPHGVKENTPKMNKRQEFFPAKWKLLFKRRILEQKNITCEVRDSLMRSTNRMEMTEELVNLVINMEQ